MGLGTVAFWGAAAWLAWRRHKRSAALTPIDWAQISQRIEPTLQSAEGHELEQGYWADINVLVRPDKLSASVESLERELPEEIRSGLNWSTERQYYFITSVIKRGFSIVVSATRIGTGLQQRPDHRAGTCPCSEH